MEHGGMTVVCVICETKMMIEQMDMKQMKVVFHQRMKILA
jgi:hypothetical protein